jgi:hypothetical protein
MVAPTAKGRNALYRWGSNSTREVVAPIMLKDGAVQKLSGWISVAARGV